MSDDELLARSLRALRDSSDGSSPDAAVTRTRILAEASRASATRRRRAVFYALPFAAALLVSTAWAASTGALPRWLDGLLPPRASTHAAGSSSFAMPAPMPAPPVSPAAHDGDAEASPPAVTPGDLPSITAPSPPLLPPASAASASGTGRGGNQAGDGGSSREAAAYQAAHRAHFVDRDPVAALPAWDAYLRDFPAGAFALEARYNRGIALVRLGRHDEARAVLQPFARGEVDGYRAASARQLLEALDAADASPP